MIHDEASTALPRHDKASSTTLPPCHNYMTTTNDERNKNAQNTSFDVFCAIGMFFFMLSFH